MVLVPAAALTDDEPGGDPFGDEEVRGLAALEAAERVPGLVPHPTGTA